MLKFTTKIKAIDPKDGELKTWCGPHIEALNFTDAQRQCELNGLGYCEVDGMLVSEISHDGIKTNYINNN